MPFLFFAPLALHPSPLFAAERLEARDTDKNGTPDEWRIYEGEKLIRVEKDRDGDGRREVVIFMKEGKPDFSTLDRNGDGKKDLTRHYSPQGLPEFDEGDLDFDGRVDYWAWYTQGLKSAVAQDRNKDGEPDAWFFYDPLTQRVVGGAIDADGDGRYEKRWGSTPLEFPH